jgi:hypothetical protein
MRTLVIILVIVLAAIAISLLVKPAPAPPQVTPATPSVPATRQTAAVPRPVAAPAAPAQPELRAAAATGVVADLHTAADYATGYTPLKIKKNTQTKIQAIQDKHNQDLEQALK